MPQTVKAKFLLGWMSRHEAMEALKSCHFNEHQSDRKALALWKHYRDKVANLEPRDVISPPALPLTDFERQTVEDYLNRLRSGGNGQFLPEVIKIHPGDLVARQFHVVTERSEQYAESMQDEETRINHCLGIGLEFRGQLVPRQFSPRYTVVDLPHFEFSILPNGNGFTLKEWDRYITAARIAGNRTMLWGGYHRTYALLCQLAGDAEEGAPLVTVMTGRPDVANFLAKPTFVRETVLGERPALLRDFLDEELFISVNLRKRKAQARIDAIRPGKIRLGVHHVNDDA